MSPILGYKQWKTLFEQEDKFKEKREQTFSEALGVSEDELKSAFLQKVSEDLDGKKTIENIKDENVKSGIVEAFIYSKNVPKKFYKNPENYKFHVWVAENVFGETNPQLFAIKDLTKIPYTNIAGEETEISYDEIISDINLHNINVFASGEGDQYLLKEGKNSKKQNALIATKITSANIDRKLLTICPGKFNPSLKKEGVKSGTTTVTKPGTPGKIININVDLPVSEVGASTFVADSYALSNSSTTVDLVYNKIKEAADANGISDLSALKITSLKVISSASNQYGGPVTATHDNAGNPTGSNYSDPHPSRKDANYAAHSKANYTLAQNRGNALGTAVISGLNEKGISEISPATFETRVTDTGGLNDEASGTKPGRDKTKYPNPGQYARLVISAEASKEEAVPEKPGTQSSSAVFTQFTLGIIEQKGSDAFAKINGLFLSKAKYLKGNGSWRSKGYIKRHGGGNRPTSGLARWFDNIFYGGI